MLKMGSVLCATQMLLAEPESKGEVDPFSAIEIPQKKPVEFETSFGFRVKPSDNGDPEVLPADQRPKIKAPTTFNSHFQEPETVWVVNGGYFAAFNGGEWGSALFYADRNAKKWTRILSEPIEKCFRIKGDRFLISGGLGHLSSIGGAVFFLERTPNGTWSTRKVIDSDYGIPTLIGESQTTRREDGQNEKLFVVSFKPDGFNRTFLGIDGNGTIYPLGEKSKEDKTKPEGGKMPTTEDPPANGN